MSFGVRPIGLAAASAPPTIILGFENNEYIYLLSSRLATPARQAILYIGDNGSLNYHLTFGIPPAYWYQGPAGWSSLFEARVTGTVDSQAAGGTITLLGQSVSATIWDTGWVQLNSTAEIHAYATTVGSVLYFTGTLAIRRIGQPASEITAGFNIECTYSEA